MTQGHGRGDGPGRRGRAGDSGISDDLAIGDPIDEEAFERFERRAPVFYLEIPPSLFGTVIKGLSEAGLSRSARVVVEKPFGHDLESAAALNEEIRQYIDESGRFSLEQTPRRPTRHHPIG